MSLTTAPLSHPTTSPTPASEAWIFKRVGLPSWVYVYVGNYREMYGMLLILSTARFLAVILEFVGADHLIYCNDFKLYTLWISNPRHTNEQPAFNQSEPKSNEINDACFMPKHNEYIINIIYLWYGIQIDKLPDYLMGNDIPPIHYICDTLALPTV